MKLLAFSDVHMDFEFFNAINKMVKLADIVVFAGDLFNKGVENLKILEALESFKKPVVMVAGNHDAFDMLDEFCNISTYLYLLHDQSVNIEGINFFGLGFEIPKSNDAEWNAWLSEAEAEKLLQALPQDCIFVSHSPAKGHCDLQANGVHEGSEAIKKAIVKQQPKLHLCGHIHNGWGVTDMIGNTPSYNLGPKLHWFDV